MYCIPTLEGGGAEGQVAGLAVEVAKLGHEVHVVFSREGVNLDRVKAGGVAAHRVGLGGNHDPGIFFRLVRLIRKLRPDVVQTYLTQMDVLAGAAALATRTRWVLAEVSAAYEYAGAGKTGCVWDWADGPTR